MARYPPLCSKCGYRLTGLRSSGQCPECGQPFDKRSGQGVVRDFAQRRVDRALRKLRTWSLLGSGVLLGLGAAGLACVSGRPLRVLGTGFLLAALLLLAGLTSYVYEKDDET